MKGIDSITQSIQTLFRAIVKDDKIESMFEEVKDEEDEILCKVFVSREEGSDEIKIIINPCT